MEDSKIVALYLVRDENAIKETEIKYSSYLTKIAFNILADIEDSQECVNDTYLAAWNTIPPNRPTYLCTYLGKITRRISIDIFRKKNRLKRKESEYSLSLSELSDILSKDHLPEEDIEAKLLGEKISLFLKEQKPQVRYVFIGRYYYLDSIKDISTYAKISEAKVKTILFRARKALKSYLEKEGYMI